MGSEPEASILLITEDSKAASKLSGTESGNTALDESSPRSEVVAIVFGVLFVCLVGVVATLVILIIASMDDGYSTGNEYVPDFGDTERTKESGRTDMAGLPLTVEIVIRKETPMSTTRRDAEPRSPGAPSQMTTATTAKTTTRATISTTLPGPPRIRELVCTVGFSAVEASMYPPDRFCDYLYYSNVVIVGGRLQGAEEQTSWEMFQEQAKTYTRVQLGVGFHFRNITWKKLDTARNALDMLARKNIKHYGVLNIIGRLAPLGIRVIGLRKVFEKFKEIQGNDPTRKTIIAIASNHYARDAYRFYRAAIIRAVNFLKVDTVIAVSSTGWMAYQVDCLAAPPCALEHRHNSSPSLLLHSKIIRAGYRYQNPLVLVGLSFELGALVYVLKSDAADVRSIAYAPCVSSGITSQDVVCALDPGAFDASRQSLGPSIEVVGAFLNATSKRDVVLSEFNHTVVTKFTQAEQRYGPFRDNLSWLLFDVHLGDRGGRCGTAPFRIVEQFCAVFKGASC